MSQPRPSASVILYRSQSQTVFLARRSQHQRFYPGFYSFIGGGVIEEDRTLAKKLRLEEEGVELIAALREVFEETGLLFTRPFLSPEKLQKDRQDLLNGVLSFSQLLEKHRLSPFPSPLLPLGRKTTPSFFPIRYQTRFFLVEVPQGVEPEIWPGELEEGQWFFLSSLLENWERRKILLPPPVVVLLKKLVNCKGSFSPLLYLDDQNLENQIFLIPLDPYVSMLPLKTPTVPPAEFTNAYFIGDKKFYLLDPAPSDPLEQEKLVKAIEEKLEHGATFLGLLLTHYHRDHIGSASLLKKRFSCPLYAHPLTEKCLRQKGISLSIDHYLTHGQVLQESDGGTLQVFHTPGHSPDHCVFLLENHCLFVGDLISTISSILIPPSPKGSLADYLHSLREIQKLSFVWLLPSHGYPTTQGEKVIQEYLEHRRERLQQILASLQRASTFEEILDEVYGKEVPPHMLSYAAMSLESALEMLLKEKLVIKKGNLYLKAQGLSPC